MANTIINLQWGWHIRGCCRQWQKLAKLYPVIVLAWGAAWPDCPSSPSPVPRTTILVVVRTG